MNKQNGSRFIDTENRQLPDRRDVVGLGEKGEGIEKYRLVVIKWSWDAKYSIGNTVNTTVITMYGASWILEIPVVTLCKVYDCTANMLYTSANGCKIILNVNSNWINEWIEWMNELNEWMVMFPFNWRHSTIPPPGGCTYSVTKSALKNEF